jgi:hypothetical protein
VLQEFKSPPARQHCENNCNQRLNKRVREMNLGAGFQTGRSASPAHSMLSDLGGIIGVAQFASIYVSVSLPSYLLSSRVSMTAAEGR